MVLETFKEASWQHGTQGSVVDAIESGKVGYFPSLAFPLTAAEKKFLTPAILDSGSKNISYDLKTQAVKGAIVAEEDKALLQAMMHRYATTAVAFMKKVAPQYTKLVLGKASFRPAEIQGRKISCLKNDTLLHVDAFPSNPTHGQRILRLFTNVNPDQKPRVWRLGEPFSDVVNTFGKRWHKPLPGTSRLLQLLGITKRQRSKYDHYMLQLHDLMKKDAHYQKTVSQQEVKFPPGSTWMVFTDQVSHAAMSGQHVFEQTFHLAVNDLYNPSTSPLKVLESYLNTPLVK